MDLGRQVRRIYDRRPYPPKAMRASIVAGPPPEWIEAMIGRPFDPRRILVAGCGLGTEAFAFAQRYPNAEIIGVDFSRPAIVEARRQLRRSADRKRMRFEVADLQSGDLARIAGEDFDYVSCHGVLSYIPGIAAALRNIANCMRPRGALVLGVNGAGHPSARYRRVLGGFGVPLDDFREGEAVRRLLRLCDSLSAYPAVAVNTLDAGYLAGDIFGPLNHSLPFGEWKRLCGEAGLHVAASMRGFFSTRDIINRGLHDVLLPRTRSEVAELVDVLHPVSFHQLLAVRDAPPENPFRNLSALPGRRPIVTPLYRIRRPRKGRGWHTLRDLTLRSPAAKISVSLSIPEWEVEILRKADGTRKIGDILRETKPAPARRDVRDALYLLYLLGVVNL